MALYAIGDIHGYTQPLKALLEAVEFTDEDVVVFLGDYVDKGPDVAGTLQLLSELSTCENFVFLRGNHDQLLIDALHDSNKIKLWECLAGETPLSSYGEEDTETLLRQIPQDHTEFLTRTCRDYYETEKFIFVHGGIRSHLSPAMDYLDHLHWLTLSVAAPHFSGKTVICGHSSQESGEIADLGHTICIDTGITKGKFITCLNLDDFSFHQAGTECLISQGVLSGRGNV